MNKFSHLVFIGYFATILSHRSLWSGYSFDTNQTYEVNQNKHECEGFIKKDNDLLSIRNDKDNIYRLWPDLNFSNDSNQNNLNFGARLYGMKEAIDIIWKNQNPPNCLTASYFIADGWGQGFGSEFHVLSVALSLAVETNRVLLLDKRDSKPYRLENKFCKNQKKKTIECYYEPWSKCTLDDAMYVLNRQQKMKSNTPKTIPTSNLAWSPDEDLLLEDLVMKYGSVGNWTIISSLIPQRSEVQCLNRYRTYVKENIQKKQYQAMASQRMRFDLENLFDHQENQRRYIKDVITSYGVLSMKRIDSIKIIKGTNGVNELYYNKQLLSRNGTSNYNINNNDNNNVESVYQLSVGPMIEHRLFIPSVFDQLLKCSPIKQKYEYYWWRAIAATFMIRPNQYIIDKLKEYETRRLDDLNGRCISTYVRHGDKGSEMKLVPFKTYALAAEKLWNISINEKNNELMDENNKKIFYIATETSSILKEAIKWGQKNNIEILYSNFSLLLLNEKYRFRMNELDYFSMILHLGEVLKCNAIICTPLSNYCRIIDELRGTIGRGANRLFADVNSETCERPPCISRDDGLINETIYEPLRKSGRIW
eukprot:gene14366-19268_t